MKSIYDKFKQKKLIFHTLPLNKPETRRNSQGKKIENIYIKFDFWYNQASF